MRLLPHEEDCPLALDKLAGAEVTWDYIKVQARRPYADESSLNALLREGLVREARAVGNRMTYKITDSGIDRAEQIRKERRK
jgi:hypothetical protein